jgi:3-hydroxyacyl-[acyl-carrier-protein] dehydratase
MLRQEITEQMRSLATREDGAFSACFSFPPSFTGFQGHFPDNPVLPGFCVIQTVLVMLQAQKGVAVRLREIASAKFFAAITPSMDLQFECRESRTGDDTAKVKALVRSQDRKIAELSLNVAYVPEEK